MMILQLRKKILILILLMRTFLCISPVTTPTAPEITTTRPNNTTTTSKITTTASATKTTPRETKSTTSETVTSLSCDFTADEKCFQYVNVPKSHQEAQETCLLLGGKLPEIRTETLREALVSQVKSRGLKMWIGANDIEKEGEFVWDSDQEKLTIPKEWWKRGQPNNWRGREDCVMMTAPTGRLNDGFCSKKLTFFCELSEITTATPEHTTTTLKITPTTPVTYPTTSKTNSTQQETVSTTPETVRPFSCDFAIDEKCFHYTDVPKSHQEAQMTCISIGGKLSEIRTETVREALVTQIKSKGLKMWIGANDIEKEGEFVWDSDQEKLTIPKSWWKWGEPNNWRGREDCVMMTAPAGRLNDGFCNKKLTFFCELPTKFPIDCPSLDPKLAGESIMLYYNDSFPVGCFRQISSC